MDTVSHLFMPGHTIYAAIKLHNGHDISQAQLDLLMQEFNRVNDYPIVRPGMRLVIPLLILPESEGGEID